MSPEEPRFDPYHRWLGIQPKDQPPNAYRLLGVELFESDPEVIESAGDQRMAHVRTFQSGQRSALSQRILNELAAAKLCLLNPQSKALYDEALRRNMSAADPGPFPALESFEPRAQRRPRGPERSLGTLAIAGAVVGALAIVAVVILALFAGRSQPQPAAAAGEALAQVTSPAESTVLPPEPVDSSAARPGAPADAASETTTAQKPGHETAVTPSPSAAGGEPAASPPPASPSSEAAPERQPPAADPNAVAVVADESGPGEKAAETPPPARLPRPDADAEKAARATVKERFGSEYADAKNTPEKLAALAGIMLQQAATTTDPALRYVLIDVARSVSLDAGNLAQVLEAFDALDKDYELDGIDGKRVDACEEVARKARTTEENGALLKQLLPLLDEWFAADRLELASRVGKVVVVVARKTHDPATLKSTAVRCKQIDDAAKAYAAEVKPALDALQSTPADPAANLIAGKWYCFTKEDWPQGLLLLAKGSDASLQELAANELAGKDLGKVADGWWALALKEPKARQALQTHAAGLYRGALLDLSGADKKRAEQRLAETGGTETKPAKTSPAARPARRSRVSARMVKIIAAGCDGHDAYLNGLPLMQGIKREAASGTIAALHDGDVITVKMQGRFDIMSLSMAFLTEDDQLLFETSAAWTAYLPPDQDRWWDVQSQKLVHQAATTVDESREYVDLVKRAMSKALARPLGPPICSPLQNAQANEKESRSRYLPTYVYYVITKADLSPKKQ